MHEYEYERSPAQFALLLPSFFELPSVPRPSVPKMLVDRDLISPLATVALHDPPRNRTARPRVLNEGRRSRG